MIFKNEQGFTLIELLVVMIIIGILASIIAGNFVGTRIKARDARRKNDVTQIQRALESYYNDHGNYPVDSGAGTMTNDVPTTLAWGNSFVDQAGTVYMVTLPIDPSGGVSYYYTSDATGKKYQIFAFLENDKDTSILQTVVAFALPCGSKTCNWGVSSSNTTMTDASLLP